jgi:hypothetical protein
MRVLTLSSTNNADGKGRNKWPRTESSHSLDPLSAHRTTLSYTFVFLLVLQAWFSNYCVAFSELLLLLFSPAHLALSLKHVGKLFPNTVRSALVFQRAATVGTIISLPFPSRSCGMTRQCRNQQQTAQNE